MAITRVNIKGIHELDLSSTPAITATVSQGVVTLSLPFAAAQQIYTLTPLGTTGPYTLAGSPSPTGFMLFYNGLLQDATFFTLTGNQLTTTFIAVSGDSLRVWF